MNDHGLVVTTDSGTYIGEISGVTPNVRQFNSVPYARPPTGQRRWLPPARPATNSSNRIDTTRWPASCAQYVSRIPSAWGQDVPEFLIYKGDQFITSGTIANTSSEDCLYLAIWAPATKAPNLPVIMFMTGGGFVTGGVDIPYQKPHHWVERTQAHIAITINLVFLKAYSG